MLLEITLLEKTMALVDEISRTCDSDPGHNKKVTALALAIFDGLVPLHHLGENERRLLEIASRMHDIGWSKTVLKKHHILSCDMIQKMDLPCLNKRETQTCALIARYHTKALPDVAKHPKFARMSAKNRNIIEWLAAILRVADALDSSHTGIIEHIKLLVDERTVTIRLETKGDCWDEIRRVRRKQDLLVIKSGKTMVYQC